jgi:hypothetical protein
LGLVNGILSKPVIPEADIANWQVISTVFFRLSPDLGDLNLVSVVVNAFFHKKGRNRRPSSDLFNGTN